MGRPFVVAVCVVLFGCSIGKAEDGDPIKEKLDKAKETYEGKVKAVREAVSKQLQAKEDSATKSGNKKIVDLVEAEREVFEKDGVFPTVVDVRDQKRQGDDARQALVTAYKTAETEYTKAGMKAEAKIVTKEQADLLKAAAEVQLKGMFATGAVLTGRKMNAANATTPNGTNEQFQLTVQERTGTTFKGEILVNGRRTYTVGGEIKGDGVSFTSEKKGNDNFKQTYTGQVKGTQVAFTFEGTGAADANVNVRGTATLGRK